MRRFQRVPISIVDKSLSGSLEPTIDDGDLTLESPIIQDLRLLYGITVSTPTLIFDIDEKFVLAGVECLRQAYLWKTTDDPPFNVPEHTIDASLAVPRTTIDTGVFDEVSGDVVMDALRTQVLVGLEPVSDQTRWVRLSQGCYALVNDTYLAGFLVVLRSPDEPLDEALAAALEGPVG